MSWCAKLPLRWWRCCSSVSSSILACWFQKNKSFSKGTLSFARFATFEIPQHLVNKLSDNITEANSEHMAPSRVAHFFDKRWSLRSILSGHNFSGDDAQKNSSNGAKSRLVMLFKRVFLHGWTDFQPLPAPPY